MTAKKSNTLAEVLLPRLRFLFMTHWTTARWLLFFFFFPSFFLPPFETLESSRIITAWGHNTFILICSKGSHKANYSMLCAPPELSGFKQQSALLKTPLFPEWTNKRITQMWKEGESCVQQGYLLLTPSGVLGIYLKGMCWNSATMKTGVGNPFSFFSFTPCPPPPPAFFFFFFFLPSPAFTFSVIQETELFSL